MPTGVEEALALIGVGLSAAGVGVSVAEKAIDPALNEALSPSAGLFVAPYYFQAIEQEGRWKYEPWGFNSARNLTGPNLRYPDTPDPTKTYFDPSDAYPTALRGWKDFSSTNGTVRRVSNQSNIFARRQTLLTIEIGPPNITAQAIAKAVAMTFPSTSAVPTLLQESILSPGKVVIDANWLTDGIEIYAGYAGLASATGFKSTFGHRAHVEIGGVTIGNYNAGAYLIGLTGNVNPVGPQFLEFRCGVAILGVSGTGSVIGVYGTWWERDSPAAPVHQMKFTVDKGWGIKYSDPFSSPTDL